MIDITPIRAIQKGLGPTHGYYPLYQSLLAIIYTHCFYYYTLEEIEFYRYVLRSNYLTFQKFRDKDV